MSSWQTAASLGSNAPQWEAAKWLTSVPIFPNEQLSYVPLLCTEQLTNSFPWFQCLLNATEQFSGYPVAKYLPVSYSLESVTKFKGLFQQSFTNTSAKVSEVITRSITCSYFIKACHTFLHSNNCTYWRKRPDPQHSQQIRGIAHGYICRVFAMTCERSKSPSLLLNAMRQNVCASLAQMDIEFFSSY